jgi:hypothetical protein
MIVATMWLAAQLVAGAGSHADHGCESPEASTVVGLRMESSLGDREAVAAAFRAEFRPKHIWVCEGGAGVAAIDVRELGGERVVIQVNDELTHKQVSRIVNLGAWGPGARPMAIAIAADELLRAAWAELGFTKPDRPPQPDAVEAVLDDLHARAPRAAPIARAWLSIGVAAEAFRGGHEQMGPDLRFEWRLAKRVSGSLHAGARWAAPITTGAGEVQGQALVAGAGVHLALLTGERWALGLLARMDAARIAFRGSPRPGFSGGAGAEITPVAAAGLKLDRRLGDRWLLMLQAAAGAPLRTVQGLDARGEVITAASGPAVLIDLAVGSSFP